MCTYSLCSAFLLPEGFANIWPTKQVIDSCCLFFFSGRKMEARGLNDFSGVSLCQSPWISGFAQITSVLLCNIWVLPFRQAGRQLAWEGTAVCGGDGQFPAKGSRESWTLGSELQGNELSYILWVQNDVRGDGDFCKRSWLWQDKNHLVFLLFLGSGAV